MENGAIADEQITASSQWDGYHAAVQGRKLMERQGVGQGVGQLSHPILTSG